MASPHKDPYLVVGTGRSGTSFVAGVMHNDMGIHMGNEFCPTNESNPDGFWEDQDFYDLNHAVVDGTCTFTQFLDNALAMVLERQEMGVPWGFKESRMTMLVGLYLMFFDNPKIVWCQRDKDLVVPSLMKWYGRTLEDAIGFHDGRMLILKRLLTPYDPLIIHFDKSTKTKEEVISAIEGKWAM